MNRTESMHFTSDANRRAPVPRAAGRTAHLALPLALIIVLFQGCGTAPQTGSAAATATAPQRAPNTAITPQLQAELDAAMALVKAEQYEPAAEAFKKLALALPDNAIPAINLALIYKKLEKPDLAEAQLKQALAIEPDNPVAGNELALLYRKTGRFAEARTAYEKTLAKYPHFAMVHKNLGVLCDLYLKDYQCAIDHYKSYALSAPNDKSVQIWIADLQKRSGTKERP
jgi:tetratricopeptide (TPR) repeat protein